MDSLMPFLAFLAGFVTFTFMFSWGYLVSTFVRNRREAQKSYYRRKKIEWE